MSQINSVGIRFLGLESEIENRLVGATIGVVPLLLVPIGAFAVKNGKSQKLKKWRATSDTESTLEQRGCL